MKIRSERRTNPIIKPHHAHPSLRSPKDVRKSSLIAVREYNNMSYNVKTHGNNEADRICLPHSNLASVKIASLKWSLKSKYPHCKNLRKPHSIDPIVQSKEYKDTSLLGIRHKALIESFDSNAKGSERTQIQSSQGSNLTQRRNAFTENLKVKRSLKVNSKIITKKYKSINCSVEDYKSLKEEFCEMKDLIKLPLIKNNEQVVNCKRVKNDYLKLLEEKYGYRKDNEGVVVDEELRNSMEDVIKEITEQEINAQTNAVILTLSKADINTIKAREHFKNIEQILSKVSFFATLKGKERIEIIKKGYLKHYTSDDTINHDEQIFVILKGKADVLINNEIIKILNVGDLFTKEYYTTYNNSTTDSINIQSRATTYAFIINRAKFIEIIHTKLKKEFYLKLYTIKSCSIFADIPLSQLLTFSLNLKFTKKQYNEVIIKQGKIPMKCYIVAKGLCRLVVDSVETMASNPSIYARNSQKIKPKALRFGMSNFSRKKVLKNIEVLLVDSNEDNFSYENQLLGRTIRGSIRYKAQVIWH